MKDKDYEQLATKIMMNALEGVKAQIRKAYDKSYKDGYVAGYDQGYDDGLKDGHEDGKADTPFTDTEEAENKAYNRGLNDAWDAARKIAVDITDGGYSLDELREIFDETLNRIIFKRNTASEAIAKIKAYEDEQEQDDWRDIPSEEMTLEQARRAVKELRAEVVGKILAEEQSNDE